MKTSVTLCIKCSLIIDCAYLISGGNISLCCSGLSLIADVVGRFKKIDSFARKLWKLGFESENETNYWPILNSAKFHGNVEILQKLANSMAWLKMLRPSDQLTAKTDLITAKSVSAVSCTCALQLCWNVENHLTKLGWILGLATAGTEVSRHLWCEGMLRDTVSGSH